jgi:hypothetical protein
MPARFLQADPTAAAAYRQRLAAPARGRPRIGLSWRSSNAQYGAQKSLHLADLAPLLHRQDLFWVDLQYGDTTAERDSAAADGLSLWRDEQIDPLTDLDAAAAQYAALDLVITASNTAAHLAGSLGLATWLLLPAPGPGLLWYWLLDRVDSPFYPGIRCFRQAAGEPGWAGPVGQVQAALAAHYPLKT